MMFLIRLLCRHNWEVLVQDESHLDDVLMTCNKCGKIKVFKRPHTHKWKLEDKSNWERTTRTYAGSSKQDVVIYHYTCEICGISRTEEVN